MKEIRMAITPVVDPVRPMARLRGLLLLFCGVACLVCVSAGTAQPSAPQPLFHQMPRQAMAERFMDARQREQEGAEWAAFWEGWEIHGEKGHVRYDLMAIHGNVPRVYKTYNLEAAISIGVNLVRGVEPYGVVGRGQIVGLWDASDVLSTHQELTGRVLLMEKRRVGSMIRPSTHSTHVAGTICASGVNPASRGMAPAATILSYDYNQDLAEVTQKAMSDPNEANAVQVSNHSYGYACGWDYGSSVPRWYGEYGNKQSELFGQYDDESQSWDLICHEAPYYLPFRAAGNDRADKAPSEGTSFQYYRNGRGWISKHYSSTTDPGDDGVDGGYDTLPPDSTAKNIMTVGAVQEAVMGRRRDVTAAAMTSYSSWGPTNDGRVKPDVVTCGANVFSCSADGDSQYTTLSGTSMAAASATGSAALIEDLYGTLFPGKVMRGATLKGLLIHTADDLGQAGPDYQFGWGLLNIQAAADLLMEQAAEPKAYRVVEDVLDANHVLAYKVTVSEGASLRATLCWMDPPATPPQDADSASPCLVNDLDLRIADPHQTNHMPYVLDQTYPSRAATTGDNTVDNVEQAFLSGPLAAGTYTVRISHKGVLSGGRQAFSLLISVR
jgi:hypothetical protein